MESEKYNKLVHITKKKQKHGYGEQTSGYQRSGRGNIKVRKWEALGSSTYGKTQEIHAIFGSNGKLKVTFKIV